MDASCSLKTNGLELTEISTYSEPLLDINREKLDKTLANMFVQENSMSRAYVVAWLDYEVLIGIWENQEFIFYNSKNLDLKYVQRLRIFNQEKELFLWRTNEQLKGRLRQDNQEGSKVATVIAKQLIFGTKSKPLDNFFTEIYEDRGIKLILPFTNLMVDDKDKNNRIFLQTHNYIKTTLTHQATYFDCRFVAFMNGKKKLF
ncbi:MAG: TIGR03984 family CRISPR-associated protein [Acidobacteria bacterium]|nr:TIGR03984 family CRISPR-associated protein [Acidobacteriota bacterium]